jgi:hypothetical protein
MAELEYDLSTEILDKDSSKYNEIYKLIFDIILNIKPYIYNRHTIKEHQKRIT